MLVKGKRIIHPDGNILRHLSEEEILRLTKSELIEDMIDECLREGLVKIEVVHRLDTRSGEDFVEVIALLRAYHPDA